MRKPRINTDFWKVKETEYWHEKYKKLGMTLLLFGIINLGFQPYSWLTYANTIPIITYGLIWYSHKKHKEESIW